MAEPKITKEDYDLLIENAKYLEENIDWFKRNPILDDIQEFEDFNLDKEMHFPIPDWDDYADYHVDDFNNWVKEYKTLRKNGKFLITDYYVFLKVERDFSNIDSMEAFYNAPDFLEISWYNIRFEEGSLIPTLYMLNEGHYNDDYWIYVNNNQFYLVIETKWNNLSNKELEKLFMTFRFLFSSKFHIDFIEDKSDYNLFLLWSMIDYDEIIDEWFNDLNKDWEIERHYEYPYECLVDYVESRAISNSRVKYILLFRILEYVSVSAQYYDLATDVHSKVSEYSWFSDLKGIIDIVKSKKKSEDNIKSLIEKLETDNILYKLPKSIQDKINEGKDSKKAITKFLTKTRNKYSHASPNYSNSEEYECPDSDLEQFLYFVDELVKRSLDWYSIQPEYLKIR